jgi:hypothetical protein
MAERKEIHPALLPPGMITAREAREKLRAKGGLTGPYPDLGQPEGETSVDQLKHACDLCKSLGWLIDEVCHSSANETLRYQIGQIGHKVHVAGDDLAALAAQIEREEMEE